VDQSQQWFLEENQQQPKPDNTGGIPAPEVATGPSIFRKVLDLSDKKYKMYHVK